MGGVRDGYSNHLFFEAVAPQSFTGTSIVGASIDKQGYETVTFVVTAGEISGEASAQTSVTSCGFVRMQEGTSNTAGTVVWTNVDGTSQIITDLRLSGTTLNTSDYLSGSLGVINASNAGSGLAAGTWLCLGGVSADKQSFWESQAHQAGYIGTARWVRLLVSVSAAGDTSAVAVQALAILEKPADWPVNTIRRTG